VAAPDGNAAAIGVGAPAVDSGGTEPSPAARTNDRATARPSKTGRVVLLVTDSWAEVYLGSHKLGETPLDVEIPVGRRRLRLYNSDTKVEKWVAVEVKSDAVARIATTLGPAARAAH